MANLLRSFRPARYLVLVALITSTAASVKAGDSDSLAVIQTALPDSISLSHKVVVVDFWASWCIPCRQSFPWMKQLYEDHHDEGLEIVAVSVDKNHSSATDFLNKYKVAFPIVFDSTGDLAERYNLEAMPTSFIYGRDGKLTSVHLGFRDSEVDSLGHVIEGLLAREES